MADSKRNSALAETYGPQAAARARRIEAGVDPDTGRRLPLCEECGRPMLCGQARSNHGAHYACRPTKETEVPDAEAAG